MIKRIAVIDLNTLKEINVVGSNARGERPLNEWTRLRAGAPGVCQQTSGTCSRQQGGLVRMYFIMMLKLKCHMIFAIHILSAKELFLFYQR